jgi:hypothetical protein
MRGAVCVVCVCVLCACYVCVVLICVHACTRVRVCPFSSSAFLSLVDCVGHQNTKTVKSTLFRCPLTERRCHGTAPQIPFHVTCGPPTPPHLTPPHAHPPQNADPTHPCLPRACLCLACLSLSLLCVLLLCCTLPLPLPLPCHHALPFSDLLCSALLCSALTCYALWFDMVPCTPLPRPALPRPLGARTPCSSSPTRPTSPTFG